jgi:penicillin amidase
MRRRNVLALGCLGALGIAAAAVFALLTASLPRRAGSALLPALTAEVTIELDVHAIPRIHAASADDAFRAQGFVHAQERFFQMDLIRRSAAGTLRELIGRRALDRDLGRLPLGFERRARAVLAELPPRQREWLSAYADGVNAGLADLRSRPPEYWLLGSKPAPWAATDSLLVAFALAALLSTNHELERPQAVMQATMPPALYAFLTPSGMRHDRPLAAGSDDPTGGYRPLPIPSAADIDLRGIDAAPIPDGVVAPPMIGQAASNQWAVAATRSAGGRALLANDPHLELSLPNLFYRAELLIAGRAVRGVGVPGLPGILIGASDDLAWGATASYADQSDWVVVELDPLDAGRYLTPEGSETFAIESVDVAAGGERAAVELVETRWGPVLAADGLGRPLALKATWLAPGGLDLRILELAFAENVDAALAIIASWSGPALSWTVVDRAGAIGWALNGPLPRRSGFDGAAPASFADGSHGWQGLNAVPTLAGVPRLVNANNRPLPADAAGTLGRIWMRPYRARRIDELLSAAERFSERDFLAMQLDTDAFAYEPYRALILELVADDETDPALVRARALAAAWNGRADLASPAFNLLQRYYEALLQAVLGPLMRPALAVDPSFVYRWPLADEPLLRLLEERPAHLLAPGNDDWPALLRRTLVATLTDIERERPLATPWGEINRLAVAHPLAELPLIGRWLRLPAAAQPGSAVSVRVAEPGRGAVFRLVVSPAAPEAGILQMGGGQSGHFLSPTFKSLQDDWTRGAATPFLAGPTVASFALLPAPGG